MGHLGKTERELVAIGAAIGSNCIPCVDYHIKEAKKQGVTDDQIREALEFAEQVKQAPARKILEFAYALVPPDEGTPTPPDAEK